MGGKHSKIYIDSDAKFLPPTEHYPFVKDASQLMFLEFETFKKLTKFPEAGNEFITSLSNVKREESIIIFISHVWLTELSSIPGHEDFTHPDNRENDKYNLCVEAVQKIVDQMVSDNVVFVYLWMDFCCSSSKILTSSDVILDKVLEVADLVLTPLVDPQHEQWQLPCGVVDYFVDYRAKAWNGHLKSYLNRGWNRVEMFYSLSTPLPVNHEGPARSELFIGECRYYYEKGIRPHLIYGTKESKTNQMPIVLAPLQKAQYAELDPLMGFFPVENDKLIVQELVELLEIDRNVASEEYSGSTNEDKKCGYGVMTYANGNQYKGNFEDDKRDGKGTMVFANGDVYEGEWRDDMICGHGIMRYANGSIYIGKWINNARHGQGNFQMNDWGSNVLCEFNGKWYADKQSGWGITIFANGEEHEGEYRNGLRNGQGVLRDVNKNVVFDGVFEDNEMCGYGVMHYENGDVYTGHFKNGERNGKGNTVFASGATYEGDFLNDAMHGQGKLCTEEEEYRGAFERGMKHGHEEIDYANGDTFEGNFQFNEPFGQGTMKYANGRRVPLINGRKKCLFASCLVVTIAAGVIVAADMLH